MRYDITLKTLFQAPPQQLLYLLVGGVARQMLTVEYPTVRTRRPDLVVRLIDGRLVHLELQSDNDTDMPWRMLEYYWLLYRLYQQEPLQYVLYVGEAAMTLRTRIDHTTLSFHYHAVDIRTLDGQPLLHSPAIEDNILAMLCRGGATRPVIQSILTRIVTLTGTAREEALTALVILSGLRRLQPLVREEVQQMALTFNIQNNEFLREVFEEGRQEGWQAGEMTLLHRLLERRFGPLPDWATEQLATADTTILETWGLRLLDAISLEEVLRTP